MVEERLQKVLAHAGVASRRACEEIILAGKVKVNGKLVNNLGSKVNPDKDKIEVNGNPIEGKEKLVYILLFKPSGYITTAKDPQKRRTVLDLINGVSTRVYPVGRLDYDTSGLLLLTNDGTLTNELIHPSKEINKTYRAQVKGVPTGKKLYTLHNGVELEDGRTAPAQVNIRQINKSNAIIDITIHEGKNRQVRRMFDAIGHPVIWLKRISFDFLTLDKLKPGEWRYLTDQEVYKLKHIKKSNSRKQQRNNLK